VSPVSRGRGKKNRSAEGPLSKRAAPRSRPVALDSDLVEAVSWSEPGLDDRAAGGDDTALAISWVTIERWAREDRGPRGGHSGRPYRDDAESLTDAELLEKLRTYGVELDRAGLQELCRDALSAEEVASWLMDGLPVANRSAQEVDWIWLAVLALWQRWWPDKPCLETVDDKIQDGYTQLKPDRGAATDRWLSAWSEVLHLGDAAGITTIADFDRRFPMSQSLFNWHQDLEMELGNAGLDDPAKSHARIEVGEEILRRFTDCDQLAVENWRRAIAEAWFQLGETAKAEQLYQDWLRDDPQWGFGWIGWASGYLPMPRTGRPADHQRAEDLLRQGYDVSGVRDRDAIADWLRLARENPGAGSQAPTGEGSQP
jgi:hypothetical protein